MYLESPGRPAAAALQRRPGGRRGPVGGRRARTGSAAAAPPPGAHDAPPHPTRRKHRAALRLSLQLSLTSTTPGQQFILANRSWDDEHAFSQDERAVNVTNDSGSIPSSAWFAWSNHAEVNGQSSPVDVAGPEVNETTGGYDLYLSYPRVVAGTNPDQMDIVHDPSLGVVSAAYQSILEHPSTPTGIQPDIPLYAATMAAMAALVAGTVLLARRQRRERK